MFKGGGVGVEDGGFDAKLCAGFAPTGDSVEDFAENDFCRSGLEAEA